jgi:predicted RND superfamily exporter protein
MSLARRLAAPLLRHPRRVLAVSVLLTLAALIPASRFRIDTDLSALLPDGAPGAEDYRLFLRTFGGFEKVFVIVQSPQPLEGSEALTDAAELLAERLRDSPEVAEARSGITAEDEAFFLGQVAPRLPLLLEGDEKGEIRGELAPRLEPGAIHARVAMMRQAVRSPLGAATAPLFTADPLGLSEGLLEDASAALPVDPLSGAFVSRTGDAALVILTPSRAELDPEGGRALLAELDKAYAEVREESGVPLDFEAVGGPIYAAQDQEILRADITRTATGSTLGVAVLLLLGFGGGFIPVVILLSVAAGLIWTAAVTAVWPGTLSVIGVGFAAALVGMGVEYGIHGGARYRQLRTDGLGAGEAVAATFRDPGPGIVSSALTTAAGLGALVLAHFRPLRELGQVLTIGVLVTLVTTATLGAALLMVFPNRPRTTGHPLLWTRFGQPLVRRLVHLSGTRPLPVLACLALVTAVSVWGLGHLGFSTDLRSLRPVDHPSFAAEQLLIDKFGVGLDTLTVVTRGRTLDEALDHAARVRPVLERRLGTEAQITTPADWLVAGERRERRLAELRALPLERAAADFERELAAAGFRPERFAPSLETLRSLGRGEDPGAARPEEWPRWMSELVRTGPGTVPDGAAVAIHIRVPLGTAQHLPSDELARELNAVAPGSALASMPRVGAELRGLALGDLARSSGVALLLVAGVVLVSFGGRLFDSLLSALPLALGCLWTFGLWGAFGGRVDLLAISTLPVLFGTGIDLGVHAVHGGRLRPEEGIRGTLESSGLAMLLITLTTAAGFGSLGGSRVPGLRNAGTLVALGVAACLLATFLVLPALESLFRRSSGGSIRGGRNEGK